MAKRKKYPKLPNGYGSIKFLGGGRRNAYAVHPPTKEFELNGSPKTPPRPLLCRFLDGRLCCFNRIPRRSVLSRI